MDWKMYIVKKSLLLKALYKIITIPINIQTAFFTNNGKADPQILMELKGNLNSQNNLKKEESWKAHTS